ncbi:MAG: hypothetical protein U1F67_23340 [Rubrivivax sp.]
MPGSSRSRSTRWCSAASTTTRCSICWRTSAAPASSCASSSSWTSAAAMAGGASRWCPRRNCWRASPRAGRSSRSPGSRSDVAKRYRFVDGAGEVGFISSVTQPFCGDCVRARLTSDGMLYGCLFANSGLDLRAPPPCRRRRCGTARLLRGFWRARNDRYSELRGQQSDEGPKRIEMNHIGG